MMWVMWNLVSVRLDIVLVWVQDRCMVYAKRTLGLETILAAPMVLLGEEAQVEDRFSPLRDSGNIDARWVHGLRRTYHRLENHFGCTRWNS